MLNKITLTALVAGATFIISPLMADSRDFGQWVEKQLDDKSQMLFGVEHGLSRPADARDYVAREQATAAQRVLLAEGLKAEFVSRRIARSGDMMSFYPSPDNYSHLMVCIEQGRVADGMNASVQRVDVSNGAVETILYGMHGCDGIRTTAWGTVLTTEETGTGRAYEIIDPLTTTGHWIADRSTGDIRAAIGSKLSSVKVAQRPALPMMSWEGLAVLANGVVIAGDELRPGSYANDSGKRDTDGGALYKFVPSVARNEPGAITDLTESPLVSGAVYALQVSCRDDRQQVGQGCEIGSAAWISVNARNARTAANRNGASGYYRPEDLHTDPMFAGTGVRFCWNNTGNESANNFAETICGIDSDPLLADANIRSVVINRFVEGDNRFNSFDNMDFQPKTGNLYLVEDHPFGEIFACLPDGADRDIKSDGCISILSVVDPRSEPTGFIFDASGTTAYVISQHGEQHESLLDYAANPVNGETDDIIKITGFKLMH